MCVSMNSGSLKPRFIGSTGNDKVKLLLVFYDNAGAAPLTYAVLVAQIIEQVREIFGKVLASKLLNWRRFGPFRLLRFNSEDHL